MNKVNLVILLMVLYSIKTFSQVKFKYDSASNGIEIENILEKFKDLTVKLPSYGNEYFPYVYTMNMEGETNLEFIPEIINPKNIDSARLILCNVLKQGKRSSPFKIVVICFVDKLIDSKCGWETPAISMYVEHKYEKSGFAYFLTFNLNEEMISYDKTKLIQRKVQKHFF